MALPSYAGRPFTTEDASVLDDKACQVEAWVDRRSVATHSWLVPACNFGGGIEWQAGAARTRESGASALAEAYAQAKTVFRRGGDPAWNVGLVLGVIRRPQDSPHNGWDNPYALVPLTLALPGSGNAVHANVGWGHDRSSDRHVTLWGIAAEAGAGDRLTLLGEVFGENRQRPWLRLGFRYGAIKDQLDVDLSFVTRSGGARMERFVSIGVTWQSGRILP